MKVYIATSGEYSDYRIEAVFLNKDKAEAYRIHQIELKGYANDIEEYESADESAFPLPEIKKYYTAGVYICITAKQHGIKTYHFGEIFENTNKTENLMGIEEEIVNWDEFIKEKRKLISGLAPYEFINLRSTSLRSQKVATKILQDKIAKTIQILEDFSFIPENENFLVPQVRNSRRI